ncbi:MAG: hypothetical protein AB3X44_07420 [Leptothrix sp. (in: b-proteobacteria)]
MFKLDRISATACNCAWRTVALASLLCIATPGWSGSHGHDQYTPRSSREALSAEANKGREEGRAEWHGASRATWIERWWLRLTALPADVGALDPMGANCALLQDGPVWFLNAPTGGGFLKTCEVPAGKAIISPVFNILNDYPCPDPSFVPAPNQSLEDFLLTSYAFIVDGTTGLDATLDGHPLPIRRVVKGAFGFTGAISLATSGFDGCVNGSPQIGISDGYWLFIDPLPPGHHELHLRSVAPYFGTTEGTHVIIVK